jgi:hypothetical protein
MAGKVDVEGLEVVKEWQEVEEKRGLSDMVDCEFLESRPAARAHDKVDDCWVIVDGEVVFQIGCTDGVWSA